METKLGVPSNMAFLVLFLGFLSFSPLAMGGNQSQLQTYIVFVKQPEDAIFANFQDRESWYRSFLPVSIASESNDRIVHSYHNVVSGFAARLSEEEVEDMKKKDGFLSAMPDRLFPLLTTHSPHFLGLQSANGIWPTSNLGEGVIIGVIDTGILPSHASFNDEGMPPPPSKWKGVCEFTSSRCNNKVIGARTFLSGIAAAEPIDDDGHGTHTASTAAGRLVENAAVLGNANGTAVGMAPSAHLAIYKVCTKDGCMGIDLLMGLDAAVADGVDVVSLSIGMEFFLNFSTDPIAIGSFGAIQKGIFVSCAAGNSGPAMGSLSNEAPWILTVGASTMDRRIIATVKLQTGEELNGESLFQPKDFPSTLLPLVYPGSKGNPDMAACTSGSLNDLDLRGKVVLCDSGAQTGSVEKSIVVKNAGAAAMVFMNSKDDGFTIMAEANVLPATHLSFADGLKIKTFINTSAAAKATIVFKGTVLGTSPSPTVASFSSRGPNQNSFGILKPDIIGPGVDILASWPVPIEPSDDPTRAFNIISGTSMATPHLSGIAALLKSSHPSWSPAAIKSAMITTAHLVDTIGKPIVDETLQVADLFAVGAGHVNPSRANNPGLVYDLAPDDYIRYLCGLDYSDVEVQIIVGEPVSCSGKGSISQGELNYPSFSVAFENTHTQTYHRTVTNVEEAKSLYKVQILKPPGVDVIVTPDTLQFSKVSQKLTYTVTFTRTDSGGGASSYAQGYLVWDSFKYSVGSPIMAKLS